MFEALINLADRLIQLLKLRSEDRRSTLDDLIEPVFSDVLAIHADYSRMFFAVLDLTDSHSDATIKQVQETLLERRRELEHIRSKVRAIAIEANPLLKRHSLPREADAFFYSVCAYLGASFASKKDTHDNWETSEGRRENYFPLFKNGSLERTAARTLLDALKECDSPAASARSKVREAIENLDASWNAVLRSYAHARMTLRK